jgi:hypothetical protein
LCLATACLAASLANHTQRQKAAAGEMFEVILFHKKGLSKGENSC